MKEVLYKFKNGEGDDIKVSFPIFPKLLWTIFCVISLKNRVKDLRFSK